MLLKGWTFLPRLERLWQDLGLGWWSVGEGRRMRPKYLVLKFFLTSSLSQSLRQPQLWQLDILQIKKAFPVIGETASALFIPLVVDRIWISQGILLLHSLQVQAGEQGSFLFSLVSCPLLVSLASNFLHEPRYLQFPVCLRLWGLSGFSWDSLLHVYYRQSHTSAASPVLVWSFLQNTIHCTMSHLPYPPLLSEIFYVHVWQTQVFSIAALIGLGQSKFHQPNRWCISNG
jgi:hypothetical protein